MKFNAEPICRVKSQNKKNAPDAMVKVNAMSQDLFYGVCHAMAAEKTLENYLSCAEPIRIFIITAGWPGRYGGTILKYGFADAPALRS
jgi:hypothetical protein